MLAGKAARYALGVGGCALLAICVTLSASQISYWRDSVALFTHALNVTPENVRTRYLLAFAYQRQGDDANAVTNYLRTIQLPVNKVESSRNSQFYAHVNLGMIYGKQSRWTEAESHFRRALEIQRDSWMAHAWLAETLVNLDRAQESIKEYETALKGEPGNSDLRRRFGVALIRCGRNRDAMASLREAVRLNPNGAVELNELAWFLAVTPDAGLRNGEESVRLARRACELTSGQEPRCLGTLDAAYAEAGRFDEAISMARQTQELALVKGQMDVASAAEARLKSYEAGKPWREGQ